MGLQPRVFHYSLDWRFLLPIADAKNIYLLLEENEDFSQTLRQVGIDISQQVALSSEQFRREAHVACGSFRTR
jgi:hypothetical protein